MLSLSEQDGLARCQPLSGQRTSPCKHSDKTHLPSLGFSFFSSLSVSLSLNSAPPPSSPPPSRFSTTLFSSSNVTIRHCWHNPLWPPACGITLNLCRPSFGLTHTDRGCTQTEWKNNDENLKSGRIKGAESNGTKAKMEADQKNELILPQMMVSHTSQLRCTCRARCCAALTRWLNIQSPHASPTGSRGLFLAANVWITVRRTCDQKHTHAWYISI